MHINHHTTSIIMNKKQEQMATSNAVRLFKGDDIEALFQSTLGRRDAR